MRKWALSGPATQQITALPLSTRVGFPTPLSSPGSTMLSDRVGTALGNTRTNVTVLVLCCARAPGVCGRGGGWRPRPSALRLSVECGPDHLWNDCVVGPSGSSDGNFDLSFSEWDADDSPTGPPDSKLLPCSFPRSYLSRCPHSPRWSLLLAARLLWLSSSSNHNRQPYRPTPRKSAKRAGTSLCTFLCTRNIHIRQTQFQSLD